jgi:DNA-binding response OmpR family regulator
LKSVLIIDDDLHIGNLLEEALSREGYRVLRAYSGTESLLLLSQERPDLVLLDLMLPGLEGEEVLPRIQGIPVIIVSAKIDIDHKVDLLLGGAVDYVTKPFHLKELLARVAAADAMLRRATGSAAQGKSQITVGDLTLDTAAHTVSAGAAQVRLTRTEYALLKLLMQNPTQVITKSQFLDRICQDTPDCTESSLKTHMSHLRKKLREAGAGDYIEAVWGIGFKLQSP